jgi:hypothetical protein
MFDVDIIVEMISFVFSKVCNLCTERCRLYCRQSAAALDGRILCEHLLIPRAGICGAVCKGATPSVEQPGCRGFKPRLRSLLD